MPTRGYEFYLRVVNSILSECSERVRYRVEHEKVTFISIRSMKYSVYYVNTGEISSQLAFKGAIYYVTITMVISSRVKI